VLRAAQHRLAEGAIDAHDTGAGDVCRDVDGLGRAHERSLDLVGRQLGAGLDQQRCERRHDRGALRRTGPDESLLVDVAGVGVVAVGVAAGRPQRHHVRAGCSEIGAAVGVADRGPLGCDVALGRVLHATHRDHERIARREAETAGGRPVVAGRRDHHDPGRPRALHRRREHARAVVGLLARVEREAQHTDAQLACVRDDPLDAGDHARRRDRSVGAGDLHGDDLRVGRETGEAGRLVAPGDDAREVRAVTVAICEPGDRVRAVGTDVDHGRHHTAERSDRRHTGVEHGDTHTPPGESERPGAGRADLGRDGRERHAFRDVGAGVERRHCLDSGGRADVGVGAPDQVIVTGGGEHGHRGLPSGTEPGGRTRSRRWRYVTGSGNRVESGDNHTPNLPAAADRALTFSVSSTTNRGQLVGALSLPVMTVFSQRGEQNRRALHPPDDGRRRRMGDGGWEMLPASLPSARPTSPSDPRVRRLQMISVLYAAKGGSGTTVLAASWGATATTPCLLVDLAGDVPGALGLSDPSGPGVLDWLRSDADADRLGRLALDGARGLRVLPRGAAGPVPSPRWGALADALAHMASHGHHVIVDAGTAEPPPALVAVAERTLLVTRACYLAIRAAVRSTVRPTGIVLVREPGRALGPPEIEAAVGAPVVATVLVDPAIARAVDAGLLAGGALPHGYRRVLRAAA
jgi:hypothetical protein